MTSRTRPVARLRRATPSPSTPRRRTRTRLPCNLDVSLRKLGSRDQVYWTARVWDISHSGISFRLKERLPVGMVLEIQILKGGAAARKVLARVVHTTQQPSGVWLIGCDLDPPLRDCELQKLL